MPAHSLIDELLLLPAETAWVEFKENNTDEMIGKRISTRWLSPTGHSPESFDRVLILRLKSPLS